MCSRSSTARVGLACAGNGTRLNRTGPVRGALAVLPGRRGVGQSRAGCSSEVWMVQRPDCSQCSVDPVSRKLIGLKARFNNRWPRAGRLHYVGLRGGAGGPVPREPVPRGPVPRGPLLRGHGRGTAVRLGRTGRGGRGCRTILPEDHPNNGEPRVGPAFAPRRPRVGAWEIQCQCVLAATITMATHSRSSFGNQRQRPAGFV